MGSEASDIDREDALTILASMGVKLPKGTKIPAVDLDKRLVQALDGAQQFSDVVAGLKVPLNPSKWPKWDSSKPLLEAVSRGNPAEAFANAMNKAHRRPEPSTAKEDTFVEVRQILLGFSAHCDQGHKTFVLRDSREEWVVVVRIVDIFSLGEEPEVPVFSLLYRVITLPSNTTLQDYLGALFGMTAVVSISTTELERKCILKLFAMNSKRISPEYKPRREKTESSHRLSFVLPLGPLGMRDLGKLNNSPGCEICGKRDTSKCTQCLTVSYCGKDCQRADWQEHKKRCRSLKGGTWHTMTFSRTSELTAPSVYRVIINRYDSLHDAKQRIEKEDLNVPPPNIHGDKAFLLKFQISLNQFGDDTAMLLYDRQKSFQVYWRKREDREVFAEGEKAITGKVRIYRWARRVGDFQFSVCFDRAPEKDPVW
ncbi:hypothetical protein Hypma_003242 [Hypsizygus marmoreus]|uniref:MYND-type domain-containing protein n=1 Tax=Hypsizygus marmoreus TaxID=39966 RepID=A0A369JZJ4_HYPMA|nr:hypothetical protein Hypma_003242 [Hypsizygus marmoreus]